MGPENDERQPSEANEEADAQNRQPDEMSMPSAEQVEQYLRLHDHVERLRADQRPLRPGILPTEDARAYQMAALFRAAAPNAAEPDPAFAARLREQLEQEMRVSRGTRMLRAARGRVSRRGLLAGGVGAAAAAAIGAAVGVDLARQGQQTGARFSVPIVAEGQGMWLAVAAADIIPLGSVKRFVTDAIVGFVRHTPTGFSALSGACTHMGCLLQWNGSARTYDCPCHGGRFTENGASAPSSPVRYRPLPEIQTKLEQGQIWVYVPLTPPAGAAGATPPPAQDHHPYSTASPDLDS
ncbi:MAG: Rieske (2Fe-2S) protein [Ktedonobacterales bacterium]|nr:Rieske (2Fe-2S) protein [Ktedonobacterales bacterium]